MSEWQSFLLCWQEIGTRYAVDWFLEDMSKAVFKALHVKAFHETDDSWRTVVDPRPRVHR